MLGFDSIEDKWKENLELYDVIAEMAIDICHGCTINEFGHYRDPEWISKYIDMRWPKRNTEPKSSENLEEFLNSSGYYSMNDALRNGLI